MSLKLNYLPRILIVEDDHDNMDLLFHILEGDFQIEGSFTGSDGLEKLKAHRPDLVLLDISMPEMDGPEVLRKIKADPVNASLPVVAVTAHAFKEDQERYLALGFDAYVTKPIDESKLRAEIARLISGRRPADCNTDTGHINE